MRDTLVLDANVIVLLVVGRTRPDLVGVHRRLKAFRQSDIALLGTIQRRYARSATTPHVLTEASNLIGSDQQSIAVGAVEDLARFVATNPEVVVAATEITGRTEYLTLGLADAGLVMLAELGATILTSDYALAGLIAKRDGNALNFNTLRYTDR